ncbi:MAG: glycosyltransferase family 4 protein [Bacteroidetes bacterium]|nr:glycosyltransferase family 4 protein [Bacteroidota bacterium]
MFGVEYFYLVFPFYIIGRILGIKVFRIITDRYSDSGIAPTWWKHPKVFFYRIQYIFFDKYLSGIVCLSNYLKENAILNGVENKKICVIPHFIDIERFSNKAESNKPFLNEKIRLGFCGTLNESNGLFILLKAFSIIKKEYSKIELFLIGSISKDDQTIVNEMIDGISDSIIFVGNVQGNKVPELLSKCDILVNPRISSIIAEAGFPTKLGEYLATKRPVVATAVGDLKKYFMNERELILVVPDSPEALADGIFYLLHNKLKGLQIGLSGYEWALENLEFKKNCKKLLQFIMS